MDYVTFLLDLAADGDNRAIRETVRYRRDLSLRPKNAFQWKITCDARCKVIVAAISGKKPGVIATASWHAGSLAEHKHLDPRRPTSYQWDLVEVALREELARRAAIHDRSEESPVSDDQLVEDLDHVEDQLSDRPPAAEWSRYELATAADRAKRASRRRWVIGALGGGAALAILVVVIAMGARSAPDLDDAEHLASPVAAHATVPAAPEIDAPLAPEPVEVRIAKATSFAEAITLAKPTMTEVGGGAKLFVTYAAAKLRWADVDVPAETTVGHVLKDPEIERGKRLCTEGRVETIERRDLERRKIYIGSLRDADGDVISFVAVGTTGELVKRSQARFCGVVVGKADNAVAIVGMFDLPENRTPIVEQ